MADYYPLIARAVAGLSDPSPDMRKAVYDRARTALMGQLRSLDPPLPEATIEQERVALEAAIARIETEQEPAPAAPAAPPHSEPPADPTGRAKPDSPRDPAPPDEPARRAQRDAPSMPELHAQPARTRLRDRPREPESSAQPARPQLRDRLREPEPARPAAATAQEPPRPPIARPPADGPKPGPLPIATPAGTSERRRPAFAPEAHRPAVAFAEAAPEEPPRGRSPDEPSATGDVSEDAGAASAYDSAEADQAIRPRIGTRAPITVDRGRGRSLVLGSVVVLVIGLIGLLAWTLRDRPEELPRPGAVAEAPPPREEGSKIGERVGGPAPAPAAPAPEVRPPRPEPNAAPVAILYEEDPSRPQVPKTTGGRVTWRTDALNTGQGQPLDTAIRATVDIPEAGFSLSLVIRRNLDATLPASHTVELNFTTRAGEPGRVVRDIGLLQFRNDVNGRGTPVAGLPVPVRDNLFLIGLSNLPSDLERNVELLRRRSWIDLPIRMASGQRAIVSFEKGAPGEAVVADAFRIWQQ